MSIIDPRIFWKGDTSRLEVQTGLVAKTSRTVIWVCESDATNAVDVVFQFQADSRTPYLGNSLPGDSNSILKSMDANRADGTTTGWYVTLSYSPRNEEKEERPDENGNQTSDPLLWRDDLSISFSRMSVPVYKARYRGGFVGTAAGLIAPGDTVFPVNSAFVPFDPGLERDIAIRHVRIGKWKASIDGEQLQNLQDRVNSDVVNINKPAYGYTDKWALYKARIMHAGGSFQIVNDIKCWKLEYEIAINPLGWRDEVPDRGIHARALPGDPDGEGGTIPPPPQSDDQGNPIPPPKGKADFRALTDRQFIPVSEPVLFDGDGQPLKPGLPPVYITYSKYPEGPFGGIGL